MSPIGRAQCPAFRLVSFEFPADWNRQFSTENSEPVGETATCGRSRIPGPILNRADVGLRIGSQRKTDDGRDAGTRHGGEHMSAAYSLFAPILCWPGAAHRARLAIARPTIASVTGSARPPASRGPDDD
jgi:hypothetical protein